MRSDSFEYPLNFVFFFLLLLLFLAVVLLFLYQPRPFSERKEKKKAFYNFFVHTSQDPEVCLSIGKCAKCVSEMVASCSESDTV